MANFVYNYIFCNKDAKEKLFSLDYEYLYQIYRGYGETVISLKDEKYLVLFNTKGSEYYNDFIYKFIEEFNDTIWYCVEENEQEEVKFFWNNNQIEFSSRQLTTEFPGNNIIIKYSDDEHRALHKICISENKLVIENLLKNKSFSYEFSETEKYILQKSIANYLESIDAVQEFAISYMNHIEREVAIHWNNKSVYIESYNEDDWQRYISDGEQLFEDLISTFENLLKNEESGETIRVVDIMDILTNHEFKGDKWCNRSFDLNSAWEIITKHTRVGFLDFEEQELYEEALNFIFKESLREYTMNGMGNVDVQISAYNLGEFYKGVGKYDLALEYYERALEFGSDIAEKSIKSLKKKIDKIIYHIPYEKFKRIFEREIKIGERPYISFRYANKSFLIYAIEDGVHLCETTILNLFGTKFDKRSVNLLVEKTFDDLLDNASINGRILKEMWGELKFCDEECVYKYRFKESDAVYIKSKNRYGIINKVKENNNFPMFYVECSDETNHDNNSDDKRMILCAEHDLEYDERPEVIDIIKEMNSQFYERLMN